jgi:hypothetical protein
VDVEKLDADQYYKICTKAVTLNGYMLQHIHIHKEDKTKDKYFEICKTAIKQNASVLRFINKEVIGNDKYNELCELAVEYTSNENLRNRDMDIHGQHIYYTYNLALTQNGILLYLVNRDLITDDDEFYDLCKTAVRQNSDALKYTTNKGLSNKQINELYNIANPGK